MGFEKGIATKGETETYFMAALEFCPSFQSFSWASDRTLSMFRTQGCDFQTLSLAFHCRESSGLGYRASPAPFGHSAWDTLGRRVLTLSLLQFYRRPFPS